MPFYFDESIHSRGGFILGAYVFGPDPTTQVNAALRSANLDSDRDEFKSSAKMTENPEQQVLRHSLKNILSGRYRYGVAVVPHTERASLGREALVGLTKICRANDIKSEVAYFDEGVFTSTASAEGLTQTLNVQEFCQIHPEQDSQVIKGIQLADLIAHTCATMLLENLGLVRKQTKAGPNSGYDPDLEIPLGFELWATVRNQFFSGGLPDNIESNEDMFVEVAPYGLHVADSCSPTLRDATFDRFGRQYLGCIH